MKANSALFLRVIAASSSSSSRCARMMWTQIHARTISSPFGMVLGRGSIRKCFALRSTLGIRTFGRKPLSSAIGSRTSCCNPELFFIDSIWQRVHDISIQRPFRIKAASDILISMDITPPCPQSEQIVIAMLALGDPWIQLCATKRQNGTGRADWSAPTGHATA